MLRVECDSFPAPIAAPPLMRSMPKIRKKLEIRNIMGGSTLGRHVNGLNGIAQISAWIPLGVKLLGFSDPVDG